jgi:ATP-binding cassette, subfamily A (ABC1), member 3
VYPAFSALYVAKERRSSVQAMQMSNGLSNPLGLWLGHLIFDFLVGVVIASLVVIIFAAAAPSGSFSGLGFVVRTTVYSMLLTL